MLHFLQKFHLWAEPACVEKQIQAFQYSLQNERARCTYTINSHNHPGSLVRKNDADPCLFNLLLQNSIKNELCKYLDKNTHFFSLSIGYLLAFNSELAPL